MFARLAGGLLATVASTVYVTVAPGGNVAIVSLIAQGPEAAPSTLAAVYLHSLAGDHAADVVGTRSLVATDIISHLASAYRELFPQ